MESDLLSGIDSNKGTLLRTPSFTLDIVMDRGISHRVMYSDYYTMKSYGRNQSIEIYCNLTVSCIATKTLLNSTAVINRQRDTVIPPYRQDRQHSLAEVQNALPVLV